MVQLFEEFYIKQVTAQEWETVFTEYSAVIFKDEESISLEFLLSEGEKDKLAALKHNISGALNLYFLILEKNKPIGWHYGFQKSELEYFMANTGILPDYQNRGIYSSFLKFIVGRVLAEGFQFITSIHRLDNNAVLIPKLKAGFIIQSMGHLIQTMILESNYGPMIQLVYPAKDVYRKLFGAQTGTKAANDEIRNLRDQLNP